MRGRETGRETDGRREKGRQTESSHLRVHFANAKVRSLEFYPGLPHREPQTNSQLTAPCSCRREGLLGSPSPLPTLQREAGPIVGDFGRDAISLCTVSRFQKDLKHLQSCILFFPSWLRAPPPVTLASLSSERSETRTHHNLLLLQPLPLGHVPCPRARSLPSSPLIGP